MSRRQKVILLILAAVVLAVILAIARSGKRLRLREEEARTREQQVYQTETAPQVANLLGIPLPSAVRHYTGEITQIASDYFILQSPTWRSQN